MAKILGKNVTLSIVVAQSPQELQVIGCARTATLTTTVTIAPASTRGSGVWKDFKALVNEWAATVEGFATVDENMDIASLRLIQFQLLPVVISFQEVVGDNTIYNTGFAIIQSVQTSGNHADAETYSVNLQGTGELLQDTPSIYGDYPTGLDYTLPIIDGQLSVIWSGGLDPLPDSYNLRVTDMDTGITYIIYDIEFDGYLVPIDETHHYRFAVQSDYGTLGLSLFSPSITYP